MAFKPSNVHIACAALCALFPQHGVMRQCNRLAQISLQVSHLPAAAEIERFHAYPSGQTLVVDGCSRLPSGEARGAHNTTIDCVSSPGQQNMPPEDAFLCVNGQRQTK